jgi:lipopolysaccharide/colanic/teichoic acid biosynthesis glycosyltransferase
MVTIPFLLIVSVFMIIIIGTYMMNSIIPFIYHQKLITIANKYMFVIEKFGYLTEEEKSLLNNELITSGFDISKISLKYPNELKEYGQLIELEIDYILVLKMPTISNGTYGSIEKETILKVKKNSFSKI